ncbi:MAG: MarR family winged helix-turn-helix transcriptional regulator, partial [Micromonosporaceae bacterium]
GVGLGTVTGIVDRLVARNFATRSEDPADRRIRRVALTDEGRAAAEELMDAGLAEFRRVLARLDLETLHSLEHVLEKILEAAQQLHREQ